MNWFLKSITLTKRNFKTIFNNIKLKMYNNELSIIKV